MPVEVSVRLYQDSTLNMDLSSLARGLSSLHPALRVDVGRQEFRIATAFVSAPDTYECLPAPLMREAAEAGLAILATKKRYDNNFFFESHGTIGILSFAGYEDLTSLPLTNGLVYTVAILLSRHLNFGPNHMNTTGCINDFLWDKRGIDVGMRSAFICPTCHSRGSSAPSTEFSRTVHSIVTSILDDVSAASRLNKNILDFWASRETANGFDVFLCHNADDKPSVKGIAQELNSRGIRVWLDEAQLRPGIPWQETLEKQIPQITTAAVFVGRDGIGPWQDMELRAFIQEFVRRRCPVIPVILRTAGQVPELPLFLRSMTWVDFRKKDPDPIETLIWGITGRRSRVEKLHD
jgi:hypothetical protein